MDADCEIKEGDGIPALEVKPGIPKKLPPGNAVQVVNLQDSPRADRTARVLRLNTQVLREIVSKTENHPIAVIAIAGPARRGKSFMLSYIVRYLQALERCGNGDAGDWMEKSNPNKTMTDKGFAFRNGMDRTTDGIWMWTRPFIVKKSESEPPIAVLVMDTEGCFDPYSNEQEQSSIVGLSLLLSSCFIYNDSGLINESTISTLAKFMQYGQIASETFDGKVFQRLMFLIRDWSTSGFEHGAAGGQGFILKSFAPNPRMSDQAKANRKLIQDNFEDYNAYLMPFPGKQVVSEEFTGSVGEMKEEFRSHVEKFVSHLIANVAPKKFASELTVTDSFLKLFFNFVDSFNEDDMPSPVSIHSAMIYSAYDSQILKLTQAYDLELQKFSSGYVPFQTVEKLEKYHRRLKSLAIKSFAYKKRLGSAEDAQLFQRKLEESIDLKFKIIMENNLNRQREFVGAIEQRVIQKVSEVIQELIMTSTKIWTEPEFQATLSKQEDEAVVQLLTEAADVTKELVKFQAEELRAKVQKLKPQFLKTLQQKRIDAEIKMSSMLETFVTSYNTWINVLVTDDDLLSDKKLEQSHKNKLLLLTTEFMKAAEEFNDEKFVQQFVTKLENQLEIEFQKVRQAKSRTLAAMKQNCEESLNASVDSVTQGILTFLKYDAVKSSELDTQINSLAQSFRVNLETNLLNMNVTDASLYLSRFDILVAQNKQQQLISFFERVKRFERKWREILSLSLDEEMMDLAEVCAAQLGKEASGLEYVVSSYKHRHLEQELLSFLQGGLAGKDLHPNMYTEIALLYIKLDPSMLRYHVGRYMKTVDIPRVLEKTQEDLVYVGRVVVIQPLSFLGHRYKGEFDYFGSRVRFAHQYVSDQYVPAIGNYYKFVLGVDTCGRLIAKTFWMHWEGKGKRVVSKMDPEFYYRQNARRARNLLGKGLEVEEWGLKALERVKLHQRGSKDGLRKTK